MALQWSDVDVVQSVELGCENAGITWDKFYVALDVQFQQTDVVQLAFSFVLQQLVEFAHLTLNPCYGLGITDVVCLDI